MLSNIGRAAIKRIGGSHLSSNRFLATLWQLQRVEGQQNAEFTLKAPSASFLARRLYATATKVTQTRSTTAKKPATTKAPAKKPAAEKPAAKKPAKKAAKKPVKKPVNKAKAKAKPKPKPKKKVTKKVVLTDSQKLRKQLRELKVTALLQDPKQKAPNAFRVLFEETAAGTNNIIQSAKESAAKYKAASTAELERLNHIANENKAANMITYKKWVESHTPDEIRQANKARLHIRRLTKKAATPRIIKDDREVKHGTTSMALFVKDRYGSGDFAGIKPTDSLRRIVQEWKELSPQQRKPYDDAAAADRVRYYQEYKTVYKRDPPHIHNAKDKA